MLILQSFSSVNFYDAKKTILNDNLLFILKKGMKKIKAAIPSFVTSLNMVCGVCASVLALQGETKLAVVLILMAAVFDFCDGFVARLLHSVSEFGKQMDSLSDLISFGVAPSVIMYEFAVTNGLFSHYVALFVLLIAVFSGLRLAKFNIDPEQTTEFKGLPTPASALFVISVCYYCKTSESTLAQALSSQAAVIAIVAFVCIMMVVNLRLFSLKIKSFKIKAIIWQLILVASLIAFVCLFGVLGLAFTIIFYVILSIIRNIINRGDSDNDVKTQNFASQPKPRNIETQKHRN